MQTDSSHGGSTMRFTALAVLAGLLVAGNVDAASADSQPIVHQATISGDLDTGPVPSGGFGSRANVAGISDDANQDCATVPAPDPVPDGQPIVVSMPPAAPFTVGAIAPSVWRHPMLADPAWRLHFEAFMYLPAIAVRAAVDGSTLSLTTIVDQVVAFHAENPDPDVAKFGWDEGTAQRRLAVENCLYDLTHDSRLVPAMTADVRVQLGSRYYGPPNHPVHNHGVMANQRLVRAGEILDRPEWVTVALDRFQNEAPLAFSAKGTSWEQSSSYHQFNVALWQGVADQLAARPEYAAAAAALRVTTAKALAVEGWLTEPDGNLVQIGDSDRSAGDVDATAAGTFRDDQAGYAIGRWSATDRRTSYYTIRYGPHRRAHGHDDRGAVTWSTFGTRVLVGPGRYVYGINPKATWRVTPVAHNVAVPTAGTYNDKAATSLAAATIQAKAHAYRVVDGLYGRSHTRTIDVVNASHRLVVKDSYADGSAFHQFWHLDPSWRLVAAPANGTTLVFRTRAGQQLTITTTGRLSGLARGSNRPIAGWSFPYYGVENPAYQIALRSTGRSVVTTFTVGYAPRSTQPRLAPYSS